MKNRRFPSMLLALCLPFCAVSATYGAIEYNPGVGNHSYSTAFGNITIDYAIDSYYSDVPYLSIESVLTSASSSHGVYTYSVIATLEFAQGGLNSLRSFASAHQYEKIEFELIGEFSEYLDYSSVYLTPGSQNERCGTAERVFESNGISASYYIADHFAGASYDRNSLQYVVEKTGNNATSPIQFNCVFEFSIPDISALSSMVLSSFLVRMV